ncbi:hypothetical protein BDP27DRAFT_1315345 [Rhodocollybia butyracea]|uniref:MYND-type domain-containing protein n=1 Tax=Rhodocollybia butyracea TaxID=206335 RepID=A0A9P5Q6C8_9AGAR|nr:hypothetical protein BDP27DRAFT_1315345 [Rhodocollybia butyracea]
MPDGPYHCCGSHCRGHERKVQLPLQSLEQCSVCLKTSQELKLCSFCGESAYCSTECQTKDWANHRKICGKHKTTDRISLDLFHPFLCVLAECNRLRVPSHPALQHKIMNNPRPYLAATTFPDGSSAKLIILGEPVVANSEEWWPTAKTPKISAKLERRFIRDGNLLPIVTSIVVALLSEMYTTPYTDRHSLPRTRLSYKSSPIADFGIVKGKASVVCQDTFAFWNTTTDRFWFGQDPQDHYWIYFKTLKGESLILDVGMFTFNMCMSVMSGPYIQPNSTMPRILPFVPCVFCDREKRRGTPIMHEELARASVLHDPDLQRFAEEGTSQVSVKHCSAVYQFMERFAARPLTAQEKTYTAHWISDNSQWTRLALYWRRWVSWPSEPFMAIEQDPGETDGAQPPPEDPWWRYMEKKNKKFSQGKIDMGQLRKAFLKRNNTSR